MNKDRKINKIKINPKMSTLTECSIQIDLIKKVKLCLEELYNKIKPMKRYKQLPKKEKTMNLLK